MPQPVHRNHARTFVIGVVALAVAGVIAYLGVTVQGGGELPAKPYTFVKAAFDDVGMLKEQQDVTQNGVRIGSVRAVDYVDGAAVVTMRLDGDRVIYRDARATVRNESALGRKQIGLHPGTPERGPLGDGVIPVAQTRSSAALDDVFTALDKRTRAALQTGLRELGGGLGGHGRDLHDALQSAPDLLADLGEVSGALADPQADVPALLQTANRLAGRFAGRERDMAVLLEQVDATFSAISVDKARPLADTVRALPPTLRQARQGLSALDRPLADLRSAVATARPGGEALGAAAQDVRGFLRESISPLTKLPAVSAKATPAVGHLTRTMADARPLAPRLSHTVADADVLLRGLAPYATDIGRFFSEHDLLSGQIAPGKHFFSAMLVMPGLRSASAPDPAADIVPYPEPGGGAWDDNPVTGGTK